MQTALKYAIDALLGNDGGGDNGQLPIFYGMPDSAPRGARLIIENALKSDAVDALAPDSVLPRFRGTINGVPVLFGYPEVKREGNCLVVGADVIASALFLLTRQEEAGKGPGKTCGRDERCSAAPIQQW